MTDSLPNAKYRYRCRNADCNHDVHYSLCYCGNCGFVTGLFESEEPSVGYQLVCESCHQPISKSPLPTHCKTCHHANLDWWWLDGNSWLLPSLAPAEDVPQDAVWLCGKFNGVYEANLKTEAPTSENVKSQFDISICEGMLIDVLRVSGPSEKVVINEPHPLRQAKVEGISIAQDAAGDKLASATLHDFRLHHWSLVAYKELPESGYKSPRVIGQINGMACGYLRLPEKLSSQAVIIKSASVPSSEADRSSELPDPPQTSAPNQDKENKESPSTGNSNWGFKWPISICFSDSILFNFLMVAVVAFLCGWKSAVGGFMLMLLAIELWGRGSHYRTNGPLMEYQKVRWLVVENPILFGWLLVLSSSAGILIFLLLTGVNGCSTISGFWPLLLTLLALMLASLLEGCVVKNILALLWYLAIIIWCNADSDNCGTEGIKNNGLISEMQSRVQPVREAMNNAFSYESASHAVSAATRDRAAGRQLTLDEAKNNPELLKDCRNSIYVPAVRMFDHNEYQLLPQAEDPLQVLLSLKNMVSDANILIIGHADKTGENTPNGVFHNIELSERRAVAVSDWMIAHGWEANQIEVRGAGSRFPLTNMAGDQPIDRRVEIRLRCQKNTSSTPLTKGSSSL